MSKLLTFLGFFLALHTAYVVSKSNFVNIFSS